MLDTNPNFIKLRDGEGRTPLHHAAWLGNLGAVRYLLSQNTASAFQRDKSGSCPIHLASAKGRLATIKLLLQYCPAPTELLDSRGRNILHLAAENGRYGIVKYILDSPVLEELLNMEDLQGNTPLHLASMAFRPQIVSLLTWDKRVDVKLVNDKVLTALDAVRFQDPNGYLFRKVCIYYSFGIYCFFNVNYD